MHWSSKETISLWLFWKQILVHDDIKTRLRHFQFEMGLGPSVFELHEGAELGRKLNYSKVS
ncbi:hypothetical protein GGI35DRAFT_460099 [Trichoderma velutinum]